MIDKLLKAGADPNAPLTQFGDTALMMAARTGKTDAIGAARSRRQRQRQGNVGRHDGADVGGVRAARRRGQAAPRRTAPTSTRDRTSSRPPTAAASRPHAVADANRPEGRGVRQRLADAADVGRARRRRRVGARSSWRGRRRQRRGRRRQDALALAIFNGNYEVASFLVDSKADVNKADTQRFTPLFWAVDRRNMETAPNFPWMVTADPLPLIKKLLDAGANPNALVNNTPRARMRAGSPRIVFATALMRAAFSADLELVKLLLDHGADPKIISSDGETMLSAAAGLGSSRATPQGKSPAERLQVVKLFVELGNDVNQADDYGITPLMVAGNMGDTAIIQYLSTWAPISAPTTSARRTMAPSAPASSR